MLLTGKKVRLYHISFQSRDVPHPFPKWGCSISFLNVGMYHMSSQSRDVPYLFPKQDCAHILLRVGLYHITSQSRCIPHLFPKVGGTTSLFKLGLYHNFIFNICPLTPPVLAGLCQAHAFVCTPPFWYHLHVKRVLLFVSLDLIVLTQNNREGRYW